jgi:2-octaprenyl-6-methoxyphenol hydroxylase
LTAASENRQLADMHDGYDIAITGGGLNGLAAALALGGPRARRPLTVLIADALPAPSLDAASDGRASAITATSRAMFEAIGVWDEIAPYAQPMLEIIVSDSRGPVAERPLFLRFEEDPRNTRPAAYLVENRFLLAALLEAAQQSPSLTLAWQTSAKDYLFEPGCVRLGLADGRQVVCSLLIAADGRNSAARSAAGIAMTGWPYHQSGIIATVAHELPHNGQAVEHFLPSGPFAILPLPGNRSSIVWTERDTEARRIMALDDDGFLAELARRFGTSRGAIRLDGLRQSYPLNMYLAQSFIAHRLALIGDAAHVVHPIAGLGFNLGLRDVAALAECIAKAAALGLDIGGSAVLKDYQRWRRFDTVTTALAGDGLNRLFANDNAVLRPLRDAGLLAVNAMGPLKSFFMREAAGQTGQLPRLMRGEMP